MDFFVSSLSYVEHRNLGDGPAVVRASYFKLNHGDSVRGTAHNAQTTADTLFLVNNHIGTTAPVFRTQVHRITFDHAREAFHANTVIRADIDATGAENTDRRVNHDIQLALEAAARLLDRLL